MPRRGGYISTNVVGDAMQEGHMAKKGNMAQFLEKSAAQHPFLSSNSGSARCSPMGRYKWVFTYVCTLVK